MKRLKAPVLWPDVCHSVISPLFISGEILCEDLGCQGCLLACTLINRGYFSLRRVPWLVILKVVSGARLMVQYLWDYRTLVAWQQDKWCEMRNSSRRLGLMGIAPKRDFHARWKSLLFFLLLVCHIWPLNPDVTNSVVINGYFWWCFQLMVYEKQYSRG